MDETIVWQCDTDNYTPLTAAQEFARRGFSEPREIVGMQTDGRNTSKFQLKDGVATYVVRLVKGERLVRPDMYQIVRLDK